jgi:CheY-like chemotaxis protein/signal transduction histidine kinase/CHASE3 domain sensor protein
MKLQWNLQNKIIAGSLLPITLVIILSYKSYTNILKMDEFIGWVDHTNVVIGKITLVEKRLIDLETGERGFLLTGNNNFLEPFVNGQKQLNIVLSELKTLISDNPGQLGRLRNIELQIYEWKAKAATPEIKLRKDVNESSNAISTFKRLQGRTLGKEIFDNIRIALDEISSKVNTRKIFGEPLLVSKVLLALVNMETGQRGFLLTGKEESLEPFTMGQEDFKQEIKNLKALNIIENEIRIKRLELLVGKWFKEVANPEIEARRNMISVKAEMEDVATLLEGELGKNLMDKLRINLTELKKVEEGLLIKRKALSQKENSSVKNSILWGVCLVTFLTIFGTFLLARLINRPIKKMEGQNWIKTNITALVDKTRGEQTPMELAQNTIEHLTPALKAQIGALYLLENDALKMVSSFACSKEKILNNEFKLGEGIVGQVALEKKEIVLTHVPENYFNVSSGLGEVAPKNIIVSPMLVEDELKGVIEFGSLNEFDDLQKQLLSQCMNLLAISFTSAESRKNTTELLAETQKQSKELEVQQEEMRATNEELEAQQEEMRATNEELEAQSAELRKSGKELIQKQDTLAKQNIVIEEKANQLEIASTYKSEFLANMSHELRTPLNSLLILSKLLSENKDKNLTEKQLEFANTIHGSGADLLTLINDILDLSKVEAGKLELNIQEVSLNDLAFSIDSNFKHVAMDKGISLKVESDKNLSDSIKNDAMRLEQVIRNLLSNAFKFTSKGGVTVKFHSVDSSVVFLQQDLKHQESIGISVIDTGVGISKDKQDSIFEAFQQEDGSTSRKYGGTGLGLSISREFLKLMGGEIHLDSQLGKGSTFTIYIPKEIIAKDGTEKTSIPTPAQTSSSKKESVSANENQNHASKVEGSDHLILIVEDDPKFAKILMELAQENGFKVILASDGESALKLIAKHKPAAIILDIGLPGMDGLSVMDKIKENPHMQHIPVHFLSAMDKSEEAMSKGAVGFLNKPISPEELIGVFNKLENIISGSPKNLLLVEDDENMSNSIIELLKEEEVGITSVSLGQEALNLLTTQVYDCMILDLGLKDMSGFDLLKKIEKEKSFTPPPIIIYTGKDLSKSEQMKLKKYSDSIIIKSIKSPERLLDETHLFLHKVKQQTADQNEVADTIQEPLQDSILQKKRVLLVDDDMRNLFALTNVLESKEMKVITARNGKEAIQLLNKDPNLDIVLMDIMMPEMDGFEAMQLIRKDPRFRNLPIIALTAKAMKGDREKCIKAGANDYQTKPVETNKLLSQIKIWLSQ